MLINKIENIFNSKCIEVKSLSGGSISKVEKIRLKSGKVIVIKSEITSKMISDEAKGLKLINKYSENFCPEVLYFDEEVLILEFLEEGKNSKEISFNFGNFNVFVFLSFAMLILPLTRSKLAKHISVSE